MGQNASAANSHLNQLEGWSERGMCCHIGHLNPPSIIHCFPMVTESPHHLLWFFRQKYRRAVGAEMQTCKEPKRPEATKQYSKRNKLQNEGKHWEIILQFFQSLQDLLALIYFWQEKYWHKMHWNKQIWVFTECYMVPNTRIFLNECLNILSKGWLKRLVVYLKLHYTGWMASV